MSDDILQSALNAFHGTPDYSRAAELLRSLVDNAKADATVFELLARCAVRLDSWSDEAEQWIDRGRAVGLNDDAIGLIRGEQYYYRHEYFCAQELLSQAVDAGIESAAVFRILAECAIVLEPQSPQVEHWIGRAEAAGLGSSTVSYLRSYACYKRGEIRAACEHALRAAQQGHGPELLEWVAFTALGVRPTAAKLAAEAAIERFPSHPGGYSVLGQLAYREGRLEDAVGLLKRAVELGPNRDDIHYHLAEAYSNIQDYAHAESSYDAALQLNCFSRADVLVGLAICAMKGRMEYAEARVLCQEALTLSPDHAGATALLSELDSGAD